MPKKLLCIISLLLAAGCELTPVRSSEPQAVTTVIPESRLDRDIWSHLRKNSALDGRKLQQKAIETAFARYTTPERARHLAAICFTKTLDTPFTPFDLAEIALAETGGHHLKALATSSKGALGVWQLMPERARSHGYTAQDMKNDEKCAEAAVRELFLKLQTASGNLDQAKKLYCGRGAEANAYMKKVRRARRMILAGMAAQNERIAMGYQDTGAP